MNIFCSWKFTWWRRVLHIYVKLAASLAFLLDIHMLVSINFISHALREPFCDGELKFQSSDDALTFPVPSLLSYAS